MHESFGNKAKLLATPIRDLNLKIAGTRLEPILDEFRDELSRAGIRKVRPHFYLSTEWGVPFDTVVIAIPFYLAHPELQLLHAELAGLIEGVDDADILRYLRHEMGHVVNYAYRLYDTEEWVKHFGSITQPYEEEYQPEPFSRAFVRHLPGWYAQKHPDEDWAETFAVWLTPGEDWRAEYADWPVALSKLRYCDAIMAELADRDPLVTAADLDEDVGELAYPLEQFYRDAAPAHTEFPAGLDGALRTIFVNRPGSAAAASDLIRRLEPDLLANVYRWTGHFPERTRSLLRHLAGRADGLHLVCPEERQTAAVVALTTLVTALAMNHVHHGSYGP